MTDLFHFHPVAEVPITIPNNGTIDDCLQITVPLYAENNRVSCDIEINIYAEEILQINFKFFYRKFCSDDPNKFFSFFNIKMSKVPNTIKLIQLTAERLGDTGPHPKCLLDNYPRFDDIKKCIPYESGTILCGSSTPKNQMSIGQIEFSKIFRDDIIIKPDDSCTIPPGGNN